MVNMLMIILSITTEMKVILLTADAPPSLFLSLSHTHTHTHLVRPSEADDDHDILMIKGLDVGGDKHTSIYIYTHTLTS